MANVADRGCERFRSFRNICATRNWWRKIERPILLTGYVQPHFSQKDVSDLSTAVRAKRGAAAAGGPRGE